MPVPHHDSTNCHGALWPGSYMTGRDSHSKEMRLPCSWLFSKPEARLRPSDWILRFGVADAGRTPFARSETHAVESASPQITWQILGAWQARIKNNY